MWSMIDSSSGTSRLPDLLLYFSVNCAGSDADNKLVSSIMRASPIDSLNDSSRAYYISSLANSSVAHCIPPGFILDRHNVTESLCLTGTKKCKIHIWNEKHKLEMQGPTWFWLSMQKTNCSVNMTKMACCHHHPTTPIKAPSSQWKRMFSIRIKDVVTTDCHGMSLAAIYAA